MRILRTLIPFLFLLCLGCQGSTAAFSRPIPSATPLPATVTALPPTPSAAPTEPRPAAPSPTPLPSATLTPVPLRPLSLLKGPTLIYTGREGEMRIFWQWNASANFRLEWGESLGAAPDSAAVEEYDPVYHLYAFTLRGLRPATRYAYRVVLDGQAASGSFRSAPPASAADLKFVSYGDTRTNPGQHDAVAAQIESLIQADPTYQTFNLFVGDWVTYGDDERSWEEEIFDPRFRHIRGLLSSVAYLSVMGNHEGSGVLFQRYFPLPYHAERYGSFDYGPAHIVLLDQYVPEAENSKQLAWFESDLAATSKPWKFVVLHEPGWTAAGGHTDNPSVQEHIQPLLEKYHVAILFAGHNHYYARAEVNGITHLTVGTGGAPLGSPVPGQPNVVAIYSGTGYMRIALQGQTLNGEMVAVDGSIQDHFTIQR